MKNVTRLKAALVGKRVVVAYDAVSSSTFEVVDIDQDFLYSKDSYFRWESIRWLTSNAEFVRHVELTGRTDGFIR